MEKMKRILMMAAVIVIFAIGFSTIARAEKYTIKEYGSDEFALVGDQKRQAEEMVNKWGTQKPSKVVAEGFTDKTGTKAENNKVGRDRANEMKEFLKSKGYPENIIAALSLGDSENARKVVVTVEFAVASVPAAQSAAPIEASPFEKATKLILKGVAVAVVVITPLAIWFYVKRHRNLKAKAKAEAEKAKAITGRQRKVKVIDTADPNVKEVEYAGYVTIIRRVQREDKRVWDLPFCHVRDDKSLGDKIWNENFRKLLSSLARCLEPGSKFESQIPGLLGGDIRKI